jgi:hypothetical protein
VWSTPAGLYVVIAVVAFLVRLIAVLDGGGLGSYGRYDDGVYYAAAESLSFGRIPYRDFVLLHPPGLLIVLLPVVFFGRLTSDPLGMAVGRILFMAVGALNAVLVARVASRWGRRAAVTGGLIYAGWFAAVYGETSTLLEPLGTLLLLVAILLLIPPEGVPPIRAELISGAVLGLSAAVKIWYVATWAAVAVWQLAGRRIGSAIRILVAGLAALLAVIVPFAALAGGRMYDMVIRDQLLRGPQNASARLARIPVILGVRPVVTGPRVLVWAATAFAVVVVVSAGAACLRDRAARPLVWLLAVTFVVLIASPSFFGHYSELTAAPAALVIAVGAAHIGRRRRTAELPARPVPPYVQRRVAAAARTRVGAVVAPLLISLALASGVASATTPIGRPFPHSLGRAAPPGCVRADDPTALVEMNLLTKELRAGCPIPVDLTGITYDRLRAPVGRRYNRAWQSYLYHYLTSGSAFVLTGRKGDGLAPEIARRLYDRPVIVERDGVTMRRGGRG